MELPEQVPGAEASQFRLLGTRRFLPFFLTQFLGAFNDNLFRNAVVVSITFGATVAGRDAGILSNVSQGLFILPFFLFSALSGQLADKYEKSAPDPPDAPRRGGADVRRRRRAVLRQIPVCSR